MADNKKRKNLGRGLSALLGDSQDDMAELDKVRSTKTVPIEFLRPGAYQPRRIMDQNRIDELSNSIAEKGILQPLLVRRDPRDPERYEIIAGERRWRAAQKAQLHDVPVVIRDFSDEESLEIGLIENLQRQDLSPLEEAEGYQRLMDEFEHTQEVLARVVGKSRSHVANMLRLLGLPEALKEYVDNGSLSAGHARALLTAPDPIDLAKKVIRQGLSVRQTEKLAADTGAKKPKGSAKGPAPRDPNTEALERDLANLLGLKVEIAFKQGKGTLTLHYSSLDQLDDILHRLSHGSHGSSATPVGSDDVLDDFNIEALGEALGDFAEEDI